MDILYLCDGYRCNPNLQCSFAQCEHTMNVKHAKNGKIKSPVDLIKRFQLKHYSGVSFYLWEKEEVNE